MLIPINVPQIGEEEIEAAVKVLKSGILTHALGSGPMVKRFEEEYAKLVDAKYALAVNSGTAALHAAVLAAGVSFGDEVILPSFTFVATAEVVVLAGAKPIFVDIDPVTYNISPEKVEEAITKKTRAIIAVDLYGLPADLKPIKEIADRYGLTVIEDAAQAHGAVYNGKPAGAYADMACWSFYASKNMTTGEGGMVTTNNKEFAEKLRLFRCHGEMEKYKSVVLGHNYRMPEIQAAIGLVQLEKLPKFLARRRENAERLTGNLTDLESILQLPIEPENRKSSWYLYTVRLKEADAARRNALVERLRSEGIGAEIYYAYPIHLMPYYRKFGVFRLSETEKASEQVFSLPVHPGVTPEQIDFISHKIRETI
ncbi:MAG: DegT/DnrJ/EryC1/StrS family aminotransferase [Candidatus Bathyarchaeota archaeon]|nr:DegT/DnrJ/EryC1/StrS family aminotransferase [Candidatus Bathyarchaeota archaeon]MCX8177341.1 DegT/DnrJ/EryC1/StrS family aminotransferase [Candidatus Bathyarchaeota archaeon]MDW8193787.1 DegT/DnrJ/EryC1/StrS family aminotransferase [Nitrososphaerota archaeon]